MGQTSIDSMCRSRQKRYLNISVLATAAVLITFSGLLSGAAADEAAPGNATFSNRSDARTVRPDLNLEDCKRRYYLASLDERMNVLEEIRRLGTDESLRFIVSLLKYPDIEVRREAVHVLKLWEGKGRMAVFMGMEDPEISRQCETVFMEIGSQALPFLGRMLDDRSPELRSRAAYLIGAIGDPASVELLYPKLEDPDRDVRIRVIQALCSLGNEHSLEGILGLFETADVALADFVMKAAEKFGPRAAVPLRAALTEDSVRVRSRAALALGRLHLKESLPGLVKALQDPSPAVRRSVVKALDSYHDISVLDGLLTALMDPDLIVQDYATTALARLYPDSYPHVVKRLEDPDPAVRKNAIVALRKMGDRDAVPGIITMLYDPVPDVRMFAVTALIEFKDPRAIRPLIDRLKLDEDIGWLASFAFMEIGGESVDELLLASGDDTFCLTRNLIILQMGDKALETLHRRALRGETLVRYNAIALLGELGRPESVPILANLLQYGEVGWVAAHSLAEMGQTAWEEVLSAARKGGIARENALESIRRIDDPKLNLELVEHLSDRDPLLRAAVAEPLVRSGAEAVPLIVEKMKFLDEDYFSDAAEILCRIDDLKAVKPLISAMFPDPSIPGVLESDRLFELRQTYLAKGSLEPVVLRLKREASEVSGGNENWDRIAP